MQLKKLELYEKIIQVAEKIFYEKGFKDASIRKIAKEVGMTPGNLYTYFRNKEELYISIFNKQNIKRLKYIFSEMNKGNSGFNKLEIYAEAYYTWAEENLNDMKFALHMDHNGLNFGNLSDFVGDPYIEHRKEYSKLFLEIIREGKKDGSISKDIDDRVFMRMFTMTIRLFLNESVVLQYESKESYDKFIKMLLRVVEVKN